VGFFQKNKMNDVEKKLKQLENIYEQLKDIDSLQNMYGEQTHRLRLIQVGVF
jgi:hypothetical protein